MRTYKTHALYLSPDPCCQWNIRLRSAYDVMHGLGSARLSRYDMRSTRHSIHSCKSPTHSKYVDKRTPWTALREYYMPMQIRIRTMEVASGSTWSPCVARGRAPPDPDPPPPRAGRGRGRRGCLPGATRPSPAARRGEEAPCGRRHNRARPPRGRGDSLFGRRARRAARSALPKPGARTRPPSASIGLASVRKRTVAWLQALRRDADRRT